MDGLLSSSERTKALEGDVAVAGGGIESEDGVELGAVGDGGLGLDETAEVALLLPGLHRCALHEAVRLLAREAGLDEGEEQAVAEDQAVAGVEVAAHALRIDDEALDDP